MKKNHIIHAAEYIDDDLLTEAEAYPGKQKRSSWIRWVAAAACLSAVIAAAVLSFPKAPVPDAGQKPSETQSSTVFGGDVERPQEDPDSDVERGDDPIVFSRYDSGLDESEMDMAVNNGCFELSHSLRAAIHEHGDVGKYKVVAVVFKDGIVIDSGSEEVSDEEGRLAKEGYDVGHEAYRDAIPERDYFILWATAEQLLNFSVHENYGYFLTFYDEYLGLDEIAEEDPMAAAQSDERLQTVPDELALAVEAIWNAMARGDLPYVIDAAVYENPLRIEVRVKTTDQELIDSFLSAYDPEGSYKIIIVQDENPLM